MEHLNGYVDEIQPSHAAGWARRPIEGEVETILIRVNDRIFEAKADRKRDDPSSPDLASSGFRFDFPREVATQAELEVEIRAKSTGRILPNGFKSFKSGFAKDAVRKSVLQKELFADAYTWLKDSSLEELNLRLHEGVAAKQGDASLYERARQFIEAFRAFPAVARALSREHHCEVLDFGPGVGWPMQYLLENFNARVTGIDISENILARLKERLTRALRPELLGSFSVQVYDGRRFPLSSQSFDLCVALACLHHIPEEWLYLYIAEFHRVLKPGGQLLGQIMDSTQCYAIREEIEREFERRRTKGIEIHPHFYHSRESTGALLRHAGFTNVQFIDPPKTHNYVSFVATRSS